MDQAHNPAGLTGVSFIEYTAPDPNQWMQLWKRMGFKHYGRHKNKAVDLFYQNEAQFVLNREENSFAGHFCKIHGPGICALGFRVENQQKAFDYALAQGACPAGDQNSHSFLAVEGIGGSVIYFVDQDIFPLFCKEDSHREMDKGLMSIDHLTYNVPRGDLQKTCDVLHRVFNFTERRYFDIQGNKTGLISKVMRSPCNTITIPINEPAPGLAGEKSQIQEFIDEFKGGGLQHIALNTHDIVDSVQRLRLSGMSFLEVPASYYKTLIKRVPLLKENLSDLEKNKILADGDSQGYLLQIFTKNVLGPVFYEVIQRHHHDGFGEGNFQALFDAIEQDQIQRGYL